MRSSPFNQRLRVAALCCVGLSAFCGLQAAEPPRSDLAGRLVVSEMMFWPTAGSDDEFIEVANLGTGAVSLAGVRFIDGITYAFASETLGSGERLAVSRNRSGFLSRYAGDPRVRLAAGEYAGTLRNEGEALTLVDAFNRVIASFTYDSTNDWPARSQGLGSSLELVDPDDDLSLPKAWADSREIGGSPGWEGLGDERLIVINEVLAHTDLPLEDAIELFNPTDGPIEIGGWYLSDDLSDLTKYRIPDGTVVGPKGFFAVYEQQFLLTNPRVPFSLNSFRGDDVWLIASGGSGEPALFVDFVEFDASENGVSFGRFPDGVGPLTTMSELTFGSDVRHGDPEPLIVLFRQGKGAVNALPKVGPVVIAEILYDPLPGRSEYVRLRNTSDAMVPLFDVEHPANTWSLRGGVQFDFPAGVVMNPDESLYVVSTSDPGLFRDRETLPANTLVFGPYVGRLNNGGERVELFKPDPPQTRPPDQGLVPQILVEAIRYDNRAPWPEVSASGGESIVRRNPEAFGNDPLNWVAASGGAADRDGDGMPDAWELEHGLNADFDGDAGLDLDGDGATNFEEFQAATDPRDPSDVFRVLSVSVDSGPAGLEAAVTVSGRAGKRYELQSRPAVTPGGSWVTEGVQTAVGNGDLVFRVGILPEGQTRFYRVLLGP